VKTCSTCARQLALSEFNLRSASPDGRQSVCRACNAVRARRYYAENLEKHRRAVAAQVAKTRAAHLERIGEWLLEHPCVDCGETDVRVLDFDHRDGVEKTAEVMKLVKAAYSWRRVSAEIAKCDVRCRNCHAIVTYERMGFNWRSSLMRRAESAE
jgi:GNAT superfamily N-acetyltransferase